MKTLIITIGVIVTAGLLSATSAQALSPLSEMHTANGVSQFITTKVSGGSSCTSTNRYPYLKLINSNDRAHVAAILFYERATQGDFTTPDEGVVGNYLGCIVRQVGVNDSIGIPQDSFPDWVSTFPASRCRRAADIVSVPKDPVVVNGTATRRANGLGISVDSGGFASPEGVLMHPKVFTLPQNAANLPAGQRQAAKDCVCAAVNQQNLDPNTFQVFQMGGC